MRFATSRTRQHAASLSSSCGRVAVPHQTSLLQFNPRLLLIIDGCVLCLMVSRDSRRGQGRLGTLVFLSSHGGDDRKWKYKNRAGIPMPDCPHPMHGIFASVTDRKPTLRGRNSQSPREADELWWMPF